MKRLLGSNQHKSKWTFSKDVQIDILLIITAMLVVLVFWLIIKSRFQPVIVSPLSSNPVIPVYVHAEEPKNDLNAVINYIMETFKPEGEKVVSQALAISYCESKFKTDAYGYNWDGTGDYSVFQVNSVHTPEFGTGFYHDWRENVRVAYKLYKEQGWTPWVCKYVL